MHEGRMHECTKEARMRKITALLIGVITLMVGCARDDRGEATAVVGSQKADIEQNIGKAVTLRGTALWDQKDNTVVRLDDGTRVRVEGVRRWSPDHENRTVLVTGTLRKRERPGADGNGILRATAGKWYSIEDCSVELAPTAGD